MADDKKYSVSTEVSMAEIEEMMREVADEVTEMEADDLEAMKGE